MRWEPVSNNTSNEVFNLIEGDKKLMTLTIHPFSNTARLECDTEKRVFLIRKEGFLRNRTVLRNEYGMKMGEVRSNNDESYIELNGESFYFTITNEDAPEMILFKETENRPSVVCKLKVRNGSASMKLSTQLPNGYSSATSLLMALCWYIILPSNITQPAASAAF